MNHLKQILCLYLLVFFINANAQYVPPRFEHLSLYDGLSQTTINCIYQDKIGFLWFGTQYGLNRYDGTSIKVFLNDENNPNSISDNRILSITGDKNNNLWIGTDNGLSFYDVNKNEFTNYFNDVDNPNSINYNRITTVHVDEENILWISTRKGGLNKYDIDNQVFTFYSFSENAKINSSFFGWCLHEDSNQNIWIGTYGAGVFVFDKEKETFTEFLLDAETDSAAAEMDRLVVWDIFEDKQNNIWICTDEKGVIYWNRENKKLRFFTNNSDDLNSLGNNVTWGVRENKEGNFIIATDNGMSILDKNELPKSNPKFINIASNPELLNSLSSNYSRSVFIDSKGAIWIGTTDAGLNILDAETQFFAIIQSEGHSNLSLSNNVVWSVMEDHAECIWIGTSEGLNLWCPEQINEFQHFYHDENDSNSLSHNRVWCTLQTRDQSIWVGTSAGLNKITREKDNSFKIQQPNWNKDTTEYLPTSVRCLMEDRKNRLWVGASDGLSIYNKETDQFELINIIMGERLSPTHDYVRCIFEAQNGNIYIGTPDGLVEYIEEEEKWNIYKHDDEQASTISNSIIRCIKQSKDGVIWVGTNNGLNKLSPTSTGLKFESFFIKDGLPDNVIYSIEEDNNENLWLSTNNGMCYFNKEGRVIKNYNMQDGLQSNEFNNNASTKTKKGKLLFGGVRGLNLFDPNKYTENLVAPKVVITDLRIFNESIKAGSKQLSENINIAKEITLDRFEKVFSFEFSALDFSKKTEKYAYKMENFDRQWNYVDKQNIAYYTNLDPGDYIFKVKSADQNGKFHKESTQISINIQPAFWQTWWFQLALIGFIGIMIWGIYKMQVNSYIKYQEALENTVLERTKEIQSKNSELQNTLQTLHETQDQLLVTEKMATLGQLTAGIAHEINNPINFVSSNVQALKMDISDIQMIIDKLADLNIDNPEPEKIEELKKILNEIDVSFIEEEIAELFKGIERGTKRTKEIVSSLKTFSRTSSGRVVETDVHDVLEASLLILHNTLDHRINVIRTYTDLPLIECQESKLNQVFLNIINNAIQAIEGEGVITIKTWFVEDSIKVSIHDTGKGMDAAVVKRIFDPFYTTKEVGDGLGLGLSISYGIIEQHNGKIDVKSTLGIGTEFIVSLPIKQS